MLVCLFPFYNRKVQSLIFNIFICDRLCKNPRVFYTASQKQLLSPDSLTNICTKRKVGNFYNDTEIFIMATHNHVKAM